MKDVPSYLSQFGHLYPDIDSWYEDTVLPGLVDWSRSVITEKGPDGHLLGVAITRNKGIPPKLCHFSIAPEARGKRVGERLLERAMRAITWNGPPAPFVRLTISEEAAAEHGEFFKRFGFSDYRHDPSRYRRGVDELIYHADPRVVLARVQVPGRGTER